MALFQRQGQSPSDEDFLSHLLTKSLSSRMDGRRCQHTQQQNGQQNGQAAPVPDSTLLSEASSLISLTQTEEFFDLIATSQGRRLDDQRASVGEQLGLRIAQNNLGHVCEGCSPQEPSDDFFNMLIRYQSSRINDQRCSLPEPVPGALADPDEDFFSLIQRVQAKRMDEQRVSFHSDKQDEPDFEPKSSPSADSS